MKRYTSHIGDIFEHTKKLDDLCQSYFTTTNKSALKRPLPPGWFTRKLKRGKCFVLLDDIDKISDPNQRKSIASWIDSQRKIGNNRFIICAHKRFYDDLLQIPMDVSEIMQFKPDQMANFIHKFYEHLYSGANKWRHDNQKKDLNEIESQADDLLFYINCDPTLREICRYPLIATLLTIFSMNIEKLRKIDVYEKICRDLLKPIDEISEQISIKLLKHLAAFTMSSTERPDLQKITSKKAKELMAPVLAKNRLSYIDIDDFLLNLQNRCGLLEKKEGDPWAFTHPIFQAYFCARYWNGEKEKNSWDESQWRSFVNNRLFHKALLFYASLGNATQVAKSCLQENSPSSLKLADEIAKEAHHLDENVRDEINKRVFKNLESNEQNERHMAANVLLEYRLEVPLLQKIVIDSSCITHAEYQLFVDEMRAQGKYHQLDHWNSYQFLKGQAKTPIIGMRFDDAIDFCSWLSGKHGHIFRLPTEDEIKGYPLVSSIAIWGHNKENKELFWLKANLKTEIGRLFEKMESTLPQPKSFDFLENIDAFNIDRYEKALKINFDLEAYGLEILFERNLDFPFHIDQDINYSINLLEMLNMQEKSVIKNVIRGNDFHEAQNLLNQYSTNTLNWDNLIINIIAKVVEAAQANSFLKYRSLHRQLASFMAEYIWLKAKDDLIKEKNKSARKKLEDRMEIACELYWLCSLLNERELGRIPAWEGILLVRENRK